MNNAIVISAVSHCFGGRNQVLNDVSLTIPKGSIFGLLGPSGAGKTTLIRIITGQLKPTDGCAEILGRPAAELDGNDYSRIGIMMDSFGLYDRMSCLENLRLFARIYRIPLRRAEEALEEVGLSDAKRTSASELSKGMRSRLLLARALMREPKILFLDEPTSGLDPATTREIHRLILEKREKGMTVFLTTHNMTEAEKLCDSIALLCDGRIVEEGKPSDICRRYDHQKGIRIHLTTGENIQLSHDTDSALVLAEYLMNGQAQTVHSTEPTLETVFMELTGRSFE